MKKNRVSGSSLNNGGNNNIGTLLNMLMNNKNNEKPKNEKPNENSKNEPNENKFPTAPPGYQYAKLIEKHNALSKKIDLQNKTNK